MSTAPFGEHLKREREMRGVSLEEISAATRISTRFLEALENDQWDQLPGGVFNRGFIRSVARFLGLDEENLVAEYALETKNRIEVGVVPEPPAEMRRRYGPAIVALLLLIAILAGAWFTYRRFGAQIAAHARRRMAHTAVTGSPPAATDVAHAAPARPPADTGTPPGNQSSAALPAAPSGDPTMTLSPAPPLLRLKMEAGKPADLKVICDGRSVFEGHVDAGKVMRFEAKDTIEFNSSDSSAVLLELNGQTVAPLGLPGQPGSVRLMHSDLKPPDGGAH